MTIHQTLHLYQIILKYGYKLLVYKGILCSHGHSGGIFSLPNFDHYKKYILNSNYDYITDKVSI